MVIVEVIFFIRINKNQEMCIRARFDKKQSADSIIVAEERKVNSMKFAEEKNQRTYLYVVLILIGLFAVFMYNRFRVTRKQKQIIEQDVYKRQPDFRHRKK